MSDYLTKGETRRRIGDKGLDELGDPDKVEQRGNNTVKLYAVARVDAIAAQQDAEREQEQIVQAAQLDHIRRFGSAWNKLEAGLLVDLDLHFGDGWRLQYNGDLWHGYYQLFQGDELLMADSDDLEEAVEVLIANAATWLQRERIFGYPLSSHLILYDYQIGAWELIVALARECTPRNPEEADRLRHLARNHPIPDYEIEHDCTELGYCDWLIRHRDGFRVTGLQDDDDYDTARLRALLEIAAYEDPVP